MLFKPGLRAGSPLSPILNPDTGQQMDDRRIANHINRFFASLTKEYPAVGDEWVNLQCPENLQPVSVEEVREKLQKVNINKSLGPCDPSMKI